jgi:hypothetical protein
VNIPTDPLGSVLFVGTGGGNDVFSCLLAADCLQQLGVRWEKARIAGLLSPFHRHTVGTTADMGVARVSPYSRRYLQRYNAPREIGFVDARVAALVETEHPLGIEEVLAFPIERTGLPEVRRLAGGSP